MNADDPGTHAALELRRSTGQRMLVVAAVIGGLAGLWIKRGLDEKGDDFIIWGPSSVALVIAAAIAIAGIMRMVTLPKPPPNW
jgi:hypothetical protein